MKRKIRSEGNLNKTLKVILILLIVIAGATSESVQAEFLSEYVEDKSDVFQWQKTKEKDYNNGSIQFLEFTSQQWQGMDWNHRLRLVIPDIETDIETAVLFITGSGSGEEELEVIQNLVNYTGVVGAVLHDVPNQPLFAGRTEDEIIAYTFAKYMETGDKTWPLLVPMTKTAVRAMDVIQEFLKGYNNYNVEKFVITGASKRGWTTWLTAAVDKRVQGLVPMVYDNLNLPQQMEHQLQMWGKYSNKIHDYTEMNFPDMVRSGDGKDLVEIVDPYQYRDNITQPKLIVMGTNDRYWPLDALNIYYDDLNGKNYLYYASNAGHGLDHNRGALLRSISSFILSVKGVIPFPEIEWKWKETDRGMNLKVKTNIPAAGIKFWGTDSSNTDFRDSEWSIIMEENNTNEAEFTYEQKDKNHISGFAEIEYEILGEIYSYCTQIFIK